MALAEAILVCLSEKEMSGYDLARQFDTSIGFFWRATHPQIYRELRKLKEKNFVISEEFIQSGRPNRTVYRITDAGLSAIEKWSRLPVDPPSIKDDLLVRLYSIDAIDNNALKEQLEIRRDQHMQRLIRYKYIKTHQYSEPNLTRNQKGKMEALALGIRYEQTWVEWCEEAINRLFTESPD
ncbi:PadR family transcriptional regulator [Hirschia baltica]|uniref:Transcriptional regulator, PadR-like family n=1 Tax=Hirschia baltica (strain ATCC 49814 / DSM 5838 / IFAM 1418) TaxID=582402 RepID=C6XNX7_HIRBI|nr:PadR family transcriptional regulator [Hirschia baltica]ACT60157.1 transcriptional regulator, PadR-like family [Hirschia baltica ATCC 49814]